MGCDIHGVVQHRYPSEKEWRTINEFEDDRNYKVFAMLANVRNGWGFAGVVTHEPLVPISEPRGVPDDLILWDGDSLRWNDYGDEKEKWLGDHSHSWVTLDEAVNWTGWEKTLTLTGIIERDEWLAMKAEGRNPNSWCGGVSGPNVVIVEPEEANGEGYSHVRHVWIVPFTECAPTFKAWLDYLNLKYGGYGETRLVFGFDS